jgi:hypothetical protein
VRETPTHHFTALEGYEQIRAPMVEWHSDAYLANITGILGDSARGWGVQPDTRLAYWIYVVASPEASTMTEINLVDGQITIGIEGILGEERALSGEVTPLPMDEIIDSDEALAIARAVGAIGDPIRITLGSYDAISQREIPLSWQLVYSPPPENGAVHVYIDAITGEVVRNEFAIE